MALKKKQVKQHVIVKEPIEEKLAILKIAARTNENIVDTLGNISLLSINAPHTTVQHCHFEGRK